MNTKKKQLIFGKNDLQRIVSVEPDGAGNCEVFQELKTGEVVSKIVPNKYFILFTKPVSDNCIELKGNQPFKWLRNYINREKYYQVLNKCQRKKIETFQIRDQKESFLVRYGYTYYKGMNPHEVSILSVDIEDTYGISETPDENGRMLLIGNTFRKNGKVIRKQFSYDDYTSERDMLIAWSKWFRKMNPSIVTGWNLYGHDFKVMNFAAKKHKLRMKLGRNCSEMTINKRQSQFRKDGSQAYSYNNIFIYGREIVDGWFLAMKYDQASRREYENYKMKYVIKFEGLEPKGRVHYDAANIKRDYKDPKKWKKIKKYNIHDSDDPLAYFDLVCPVFFHYTKSVPRSFQSIVNSATGSQFNSVMVRAYLQQGHSIARPSEPIKYPGAISFCMPGIHKNVFKVDVQSLYPSIILSYQLYDKKKDPYGYFLKILQVFTEQRIKNKQLHKKTNDKKYKDKSDSQKIFCNTGYGFAGAPRLNYNSPKRLAARVTEIGREILMDAIEYATGKREIPEGAIGAKVDTRKEEL